MIDFLSTAKPPSSLLRTRSAVVAAVLYLVIALVCTQVPLLNYLGYEFSVVMALAGSLIAGTLTIGAVSKVYRLDTEAEVDHRLVLSGFRDILLLNVLLLAVPLAVISGNAFFVKNCSFLEGFAFYILLPVVSVWFASCLGLFCAVHYRFAKTLFFLFLLATLAYAVVLGYVTPAIYSYNFFYGYFPGFSYDEILGIGLPLMLFRIITLLIGGLFLWLSDLLLAGSVPADAAWKKGLRLLEVLVHPHRALFTAAVVLALALLFLYRCELGFETTGGFVRRVLGEEYRSEHFVLYYSRTSYGEEEIRRIAAAHEFRLSQILSAFVLREHPPIESYVYPSAEVKRRLIGTGTTNIAKPWLRQIHTTKQSLDATLKHELVHVVAGQFGIPIIQASLSTGLVEGLAMAIEWDFGNRTLHQYAAGMEASGLAPDIASIMTPGGFAAQSSSVSYVLAGSFCRYLIDEYGIRPMTNVYRSGDYSGAYGKPLRSLMDEWYVFLDGIPPTGRDAIDVLFRQPAIFQKVCARVIARRNDEARRLFAERDYAEARRLYGQSFREAGGYESLSGSLSSALRMGEYATVVGVLDSLRGKSERPGQYAPLFLYGGDALWALGDTERAQEFYERIRKEDIAENLTEAATVRSIALRDSTVPKGFLRYFLSEAHDSVRVILLDSLSALSPDNPLLPYVRGRLMARMGRYGEAAAALERLNMANVSPALEALRLKTMASSLFQLQRYAEARTAFSLSLNALATEVARLDIADWIDRCEWMTSHGI